MLVNKSYFSHTFLYTSPISFLKRVLHKKPISRWKCKCSGCLSNLWPCCLLYIVVQHSLWLYVWSSDSCLEHKMVHSFSIRAVLLNWMCCVKRATKWMSTVEQKVLFFLFAVRQCLKMSVIPNVWCAQVVSGIYLFIHPRKNVVPFKVVSEPDDGTTIWSILWSVLFEYQQVCPSLLLYWWWYYISLAV